MSTTTTAIPQGRRATAVRLLAVLGPLLLVSLLIMSNSRAAFTDTTEADGSWTTSDVVITDDAAGVLFDADGLVPGAVLEEDVTVTYGGSAPSVDVRLYGKDFTNDDALAEALTLEVGTATGSDDVFTGTLAEFATDHVDFDGGVDAWDAVSPNETRDYYFKVTFDAEAGKELMNKTASLTFVWEAQSNPA